MSPVPGAPTLPAPSGASQGGNSQGGQSPSAAPMIPFTRASRKKTRLAGQVGPITMTAAQQPLQPISLPAAGWLRRLRIQVTIASAGNSAAVAFQPDAPYNILQQITFLSASGDSLVSLIDGFTLYCLNKYGAFSTGLVDPLADPFFTRVTGSGATGGSATFNIFLPVEIDARDAFCALQNMAANQSFMLNLAINSLAQVYSVAPTVAPTVTLLFVMEYWSGPADTSGAGNPQATRPPGAGSVSLLQIQSPNINPSSQQDIQLANVGNTIRFVMFILRTAAGVRTEADFPAVSNILVNNDLWYYKTKVNWRAEMASQYDLLNGVSATPALSTLDAGVFVWTDLMNDGASGDNTVQGASNRNLWLVTGSATAVTYEAVNWGAAASNLLIVSNAIRPADPAGMYAANLI